MIDAFEMGEEVKTPERVIKGKTDDEDPHNLQYRGFTTVKKYDKRESILQPSINNYLTPFHVILIEEVILKNHECMGLFPVSTFMKIS